MNESIYQKEWTGKEWNVLDRNVGDAFTMTNCRKVPVKEQCVRDTGRDMKKLASKVIHVVYIGCNKMAKLDLTRLPKTPNSS